jgi:hypothetical protein
VETFQALLACLEALIKQQAAQFLFRKIFGAFRLSYGRDYTAPEALFFAAGNRRF